MRLSLYSVRHISYKKEKFLLLMCYVSYHKTNRKVNCNQDEIGSTQMKQTFKRGIFIKTCCLTRFCSDFLMEIAQHLDIYFAIDNAHCSLRSQKCQCFTSAT